MRTRSSTAPMGSRTKRVSIRTGNNAIGVGACESASARSGRNGTFGIVGFGLMKIIAHARSRRSACGISLEFVDYLITTPPGRRGDPIGPFGPFGGGGGGGGGGVMSDGTICDAWIATRTGSCLVMSAMWAGLRLQIAFCGVVGVSV